MIAMLFCAAFVSSARAVPVDPDQVVSVIALNNYIREDWPAPGVIGIRRPGTTGDITVNFTVTGTARLNTDYTADATTSLTIPDGSKEAWVRFSGKNVALPRPMETLIVTLQAGTGYTLTTNATQKAVTLSLYNLSAKPGPHAAARFLIQAAFGPDSDSTADADVIPQNVQTVMSQGFAGWLNDQFGRPVGLQKPYIDYGFRIKKPVAKVTSWWNRAMGVPSLYPGGRAQAPDPLRQRMAFALSEIFVISDRVDGLGGQDQGLASYYDMLLNGAFGRFDTLLYNVSMHPCMGIYLSHLGNQKADPAAGTFPDENFAREVMQLFSIGLWQLNNDGTQMLDGDGNPIPTYDNATITQMARVFTGLVFGPPFDKYGQDYVHPMAVTDNEHDLDAKTVVGGIVIPARTASDPDAGTAGLADIHDAINILFNHPSCPPFICKQLIQRFTTSNPSPAYVGRVSAVFINNGSGVRGDLKAVLRAILLDPEARDPASLSNPVFGKVREPYLRTVNLARAFNAVSKTGVYNLDYVGYDQLQQQPYSSPSVFNFFKPGYSPPGPVSDAGLVAPEFQIINSLTALSGANYYRYSIEGGFNLYYVPSGTEVKAQMAAELALADNVPALMRRLDLVLTGGTLPAQQHEIIREAVETLTPATNNYPSNNYRLERVKMAIYLISTAPEFAMLR